MQVHLDPALPPPTLKPQLNFSVSGLLLIYSHLPIAICQQRREVSEDSSAREE